MYKSYASQLKSVQFHARLCMSMQVWSNLGKSRGRYVQVIFRSMKVVAIQYKSMQVSKSLCKSMQVIHKLCASHF